jgi:hypothetical protein
MVSHEEWFSASLSVDRYDDTYPRIHDSTALPGREGEDWIQIEFADLWNFFNETGHPQQGFFKGFQIGRSRFPVA